LGQRSEEFRELYEEHSIEVLNHVLRRGLARAQAEDVVAATFLVAWRRFRALPDRPLPWLLGVARKVMANEFRSAAGQEALRAKLRSRVRETVLQEAEADWQTLTERPEWVSTALSRLEERDQQVLALVYWDGLSCQEAAVYLGCSTATLRVRLYRARGRAAAALRAVDEEEARAPASGPETNHA
jgi:RNA polymerase sigma-70 factor, ECF subfamily